MFLSKHSNAIYCLWFNNVQVKKEKVTTRCTYKVVVLRFLQSFKRDEYERRQKAMSKLLSDFFRDFLAFADANFSSGTVNIYKAAIRNFLEFSGDLPLTSYTPQYFDAHNRH